MGHPVSFHELIIFFFFFRPGSRYQGRQHSSVVGDSCFGDAGGSVWKYWKFKDPASNAPVRPDHGTLAVLTGVVSRYLDRHGNSVTILIVLRFGISVNFKDTEK